MAGLAAILDDAEVRARLLFAGEPRFGEDAR